MPKAAGGLGAKHSLPPPLPVIVEVDGPPHFFNNVPRRSRGDHKLKVGRGRRGNRKVAHNAGRGRRRRINEGITERQAIRAVCIVRSLRDHSSHTFPPPFFPRRPSRAPAQARILEAQTGKKNGGVVSVTWWEWVCRTRRQRTRMMVRKLVEVGVTDPSLYLRGVAALSSEGEETKRRG